MLKERTITNEQEELLQYINKLILKFENQNFSESTIKKYKNHLMNFYDFCNNNNVLDFFSNYTINLFFSYDNSKMKNISLYYENLRKRAIYLLRDYSIKNIFIISYKKNKIKISSKKFIETYTHFETFLKNSSIRESTIEKQCNSIYNFLIYLEKNNILNFDSLNTDIVRKYISSLKYAHQTKCNLSKILKKFLNFTFENNITSFSGKHVFPSIRTNYRERILSFYSVKEISKLIGNINTNTSVGKRDYLIVLIAATLGLRVGDISNLTLKNIDFEKKYIKIIQQKTKKDLIQPFSDEILFALLDYLKNARPKCNSDKILITMTPPFRALTTSAISQMIKRYFNISNIDISKRKHGAHSLRHSLANNMLTDDVSLQDISATLGHSYLSTSTLYTNVDLKHLKAISLEVPKYDVK